MYNKLAIVQKVINSKTPIPIAENFLFKIENNVLTIVATDLETTLSTAINLENCPGSIIFAMPPKIMEILKELPEQILSISIDEETFKIDLQNESGSYKGDFLGIGVGQNGEDFPCPKELDTEYKSSSVKSDNIRTFSHRRHCREARDLRRNDMVYRGTYSIIAYTSLPSY